MISVTNIVQWILIYTELLGTGVLVALVIVVVGTFNNNRGDKNKHMYTLQWRHNERDCVSNHQPRDCLLNRLVKTQGKENIKAPRHWWILRTKSQ